MTHVRFGRSHLHPVGQLTDTRRSDGTPDPDGTLKETVMIKIRHYLNIYLNTPDPIVLLPLEVDTSALLYDDFIRFLFLVPHPSWISTHFVFFWTSDLTIPVRNKEH